jgi:predicted RNA-binding protein YlxR (DUF448 family)
VAKALISCNRKQRPPIRDCIVSREKRGAPPGDNLYRGVSKGKMTAAIDPAGD